MSMGKYLRRLVALAVLLTTAGASARNLTDVMTDSIIRSHQVIYFGSGDTAASETVRSQIAKFYVDQFRHFSDPLAPYFLFMSRDANLAMGVGGCVRMRGWYDWGGSIPTPGFAPYMIPMTDTPLRERYLGTTPSGTALFFRVIGTNKTLGEYQLYVETNFNGYNGRDLHLKKAYAVLNDFTIGYTNSTFSDPSALPPTVDASGPNCKMSATSVLVRWMHSLPHGLVLAASVETPSDQIQTVEGETAKVECYIPDSAAFIQKEWGGGNHVRLSGILRSHPYRNLIQQKNHNTIGWGLQMTTTLHPLDCLTLYGCFNGGYGYESLGGDWLMGNYDLVSDVANPGKMYAPAAFGGYGCIQYNIKPELFVSATVGGAAYRPRSGVSPDEYRNGLYMAANCYWNLTARIQVAAEFNLGRRQNVDNTSRWARRVGLMAQFSF